MANARALHRELTQRLETLRLAVAVHNPPVRMLILPWYETDPDNLNDANQQAAMDYLCEQGELYGGMRPPAKALSRSLLSLRSNGTGNTPALQPPISRHGGRTEPYLSIRSPVVHAE